MRLFLKDRREFDELNRCGRPFGISYELRTLNGQLYAESEERQEKKTRLKDFKDLEFEEDEDSNRLNWKERKRIKKELDNAVWLWFKHNPFDIHSLFEH